ncbi:MFS transporter [Actinoplanes teichomyceticus]|uniref:Putative MFS family arabinose efflux permease n=1 Tax=Actinoplanes teichomyceticus TaxID=1867 RepID=A0A561VCA5_ACTTI|nr:MFS transporter [Actinoplanes teichomyceticus]TWG09245.1 putative MFS family arabinose efflux permease [Actinoplanes teichomyceticus]GIF17112.1 MFS transporter [Actinoplanes teichomyceticus]
MTAPLSRNRDYRLLWLSQAGAEFGHNATTIAFPLLVLAVSGSTAASGLVLSAIAAAQLVAGLPAGAVADRWNRKRVMLACEAAQALALAGLVAAVLAGVATVPHMVAVAAVLGVCTALFEPAEDATLAALVPEEQLGAAVAANAARTSLGQVAGTAAGGVLFAAGRFLPFAVDVLTHVAAFAALAFLRVPPRRPAPEPVRRLGPEMLAGLRWMWRHPVIRSTTGYAVVLNLFFSAFYLVVIVLAQRRGATAAEIGLMAAMLGAGGVAGALLAPPLHRLLGPYVSVTAVFWVLSVLVPLTAPARDGYLIGALFALMALLAPTANTTIVTQQMLLTPDGLRGRLSGALGLLTGAAGALGPVLGGLLTELLPGTGAVLVCAAGMAVVTVLATASPVLRALPRRQPAPVPE